MIPKRPNTYNSFEITRWEGLQFIVRKDTVDYASLEWMKNGIFWRVFCDINVSPESTIFDLGSHIGSFGIRAAAHSNCRVLCVEPEATSHRMNVINSLINELNDRVTCVHACIGAADGKRTLHYATNNWAHSTVGVGGPDNVLTGDVAEVDCMSLHSCFKIMSTKYCALMKVNIEGAEFELFESVSDSVLQNIGCIVAELHFDMGHTSEGNFVLDRLKSAGFDVHIFPDTKSRAFLTAHRVLSK
jgi:FkbM family methyltransferase